MKDLGTLRVTTPGDREIVLTRTFDAPRGRVFEALTDPALLPRWLAGPPGWSMVVCENDLKVGGRFRHVWRGRHAGAEKDSGVDLRFAGHRRITRRRAPSGPLIATGDSPGAAELDAGGLFAPLFLLAVVLVEQLLAQPDRFRRHLDQLIVLDVGERLLQRHADRRG